MNSFTIPPHRWHYPNNIDYMEVSEDEDYSERERDPPMSQSPRTIEQDHLCPRCLSSIIKVADDRPCHQCLLELWRRRIYRDVIPYHWRQKQAFNQIASFLIFDDRKIIKTRYYLRILQGSKLMDTLKHLSGFIFNSLLREHVRQEHRDPLTLI